MNPRVLRWIIIIAAIPIGLLLINGVTALMIVGINHLNVLFKVLMRPISGEPGLEQLIRVSLYLVFAILAVQFLFRDRGGRR